MGEIDNGEKPIPYSVCGLNNRSIPIVSMEVQPNDRFPFRVSITNNEWRIDVEGITESIHAHESEEKSACTEKIALFFGIFKVFNFFFHISFSHYRV